MATKTAAKKAPAPEATRKWARLVPVAGVVAAWFLFPLARLALPAALVISVTWLLWPGRAEPGRARSWVLDHLPGRLQDAVLKLRQSAYTWRCRRQAQRQQQPAEDPGPAPEPTGPPMPPPPTYAPAGPTAADGPMPAAPVHVAQADLLHAIYGLVGMASNGDIHVIRRVIATIAAATDAMGGAVTHLATRLAEPDKQLGHEIWEPLAMSGAQMHSSSLHAAQSCAMVNSLLAMSVGTLAESPRRAPHHSLLNGGS